MPNTESSDRDIVVIAGGVGAAKFLRGLMRIHPHERITAIVNVADDFVLHGLSISPDLDTVTYTIAEQINPETGWGRAGETWNVITELDRYGGETWFRLGDLDLALHLYRTQRLGEGASLAEVTAEVTAAWDIGPRILPVTNNAISTKLTVEGEGEIDFQDYFVARQHSVEVSDVRFQGVDDATPAPGVLEAIEGADLIVMAPSNPVVSIGPVLAVPGVRAAIEAARARSVGISPIVGGAALKGPADRMLTELGHEASAVGVARLYRDLVSTLVIDEVDADLVDGVIACGLECVVADTIMSDPERASAVAASVIGALAP